MTPPDVLFTPAPLRRRGALAADAEKRFRRSQAATLALLRASAIAAGLALLAVLLLARNRWMVWNCDPATDIRTAVFWAWASLVLCSLLLFYAAYRHRRACYMFAFRLTATVFLLLVSLNVLGQAATGASALGPLRLADISVFPWCLC